MFGVRPFHPQNFLLESTTVAEACALSMVFWPEFIEYRGCVAIEWKFSRENVDLWLTEFVGDTSAVEQIINHVHLWETVNITGSAEQSAASWLANRIGSMWQERLREAFPDRAFVVTVSNEPTDYGPTITFKSAKADDGGSTSIR